ncbi:MAG: hypothetical protein E7167_00155 [Firmicutes bacterium]|nr:hypothetical protein [Bacillota bacterium]
MSTTKKSYAYELLSKLFPSIPLSEDVYLKYEDNGTILDRKYLEPYSPGIIETHFIPIYYYGPYSKQIAILIKELIESRNDSFYPTFLKDYKLIALAPKIDAQNYPNYLVLTNYNIRIMRLQIEQLINTAIFFKYQEKLTSLNLSYIDFNYKDRRHFGKIPALVYCEESDLNTLLEACFDENDYETIKEYLDNPDIDINDLKERLKSKKRFIWLNDLLENRMPDFVKNNIELVTEAITTFTHQTSIDASTGAQQIKYALSEPLTKEEAISYVREFLLKIDSSRGLLDMFDQNILNGSLIIFNPNEKDPVTRYIHENYHPEYNTDSAFVTPFHKFACIPLQNNILDIYTIVHEFIHFFTLYARYDSVDLKAYKSQEKFLNEFASIYFEKLVKEFLLEKGYSMEAINAHTVLRYLDSINIINEIKPVIDKYLLKRKKGPIIPSDFTDQADYENNESCDSLIKILLKAEKLLDKNLGYPLGIYLSSLLNSDKETIEMVLASTDERSKLDGTEEANLNIILNYALSLPNPPGR